MPPRKATSSKVQEKSKAQPVDPLPASSPSPPPALSHLQPAIGIPAAKPELSSTVKLNTQPLGDQFSLSQVSFAITLIRSKPPDVTTKDFTNHLLKNVKHEEPSPPGERRCVDTVEFWKDKYSKLSKEKEILEAEVEGLKYIKVPQLTNEAIEFQNIIRNTEVAQFPAFRKRKLDGLHSHPEEDSDDDELSQRPSKSRPSMSTSCFNIFMHAQVLHKHLQNPLVPADVLLKSLHATICYLSLTIERTTTEYSNYCPRAELQRSLKIAAAVYNICLKGLSHLCRDIRGRSLKGQVIYSLVKLFKSVLTDNQDLCPILAAAEILQRNEITSPHCPTKDEQQMKPPYLLTERTRLLAAILTSPEYNTNNSAHLDVLEGLLAVLLKRIGELVSNTVFGEKISDSKLPGYISTAPIDGVPDPIQALAIKLETEHMKWLLRRVTRMGGRGGGTEQANEDVNVTARHLSDLIKCRTTHPGIDADAVLSIVKRKLQDTLLKGVFGEDGAEFQFALKVPEWDGEEEEEQMGISGEIGNGFVETVWESVGWEMLGVS